jgi:glycosyltransferase involved in cell wall biosynthesis
MSDLLLRPKLSILVTTYNLERYIKACLDSIISQQVNFKYEILIGEDNSKDGTVEIIKEYELKHPDLFRVFYNNPNLGYSSNLRHLIEQAKGELLIQIDGDDYIIDSTKLQQQVDALDTHKECAICFHNYCIVDSNGENRVDNVYAFKGDAVMPNDYLLKTVLGPGNLAMMRRSALPEIIPTWINLSGNQVDYVTHCMAATEGRIYYIDKIMTAYRKHAGSVTAVESEKKAFTWRVYNIENLAKFYKAKANSLSAEGAAYFKSVLPYRYMSLGYFCLSKGELLNFVRYFGKGFYMRPDFHPRMHKYMLYTAAPELAKKLSRLKF